MYDHTHDKTRRSILESSLKHEASNKKFEQYKHHHTRVIIVYKSASASGKALSNWSPNCFGTKGALLSRVTALTIL